MAKLPPEVRAKPFLTALQNTDWAVKSSALWGLFYLEHPDFNPQLAAAINHLPSTSTGSYWNSPETDFCYLVIRSADEKVWRAFNRWADRADLGLRMEFLRFMNYPGALKTNLAQRIVFCRRFLADGTIRKLSDNPAKYDGPNAGFQYASLRVRDEAAMELETLLTTNDPAKPRNVTQVLTAAPAPEKVENQYPAPDAPEWKALHKRVEAMLKSYDAQKAKEQ